MLAAKKKNEEAEKAKQAKKDSIAAEEAKQAQIAAEKKAEKERIAAEEAEQARVAAEEAEQARVAAEEAEQARVAAEEAEQARVAAAEAEQARVAAEEAEQARVAAEEAEQARLAALRIKISNIESKIKNLNIDDKLNKEITEIQNDIDKIKQDPLSKEIKGTNLYQLQIDIVQEKIESKKDELKKIMIKDIEERINNLNVISKTSSKYKNILTDITTNILLLNDTKSLQQKLEDKLNENADMGDFNRIKESLKKFFVIDEEVPFSSKERGKEFKNTRFDKPYDINVIYDIMEMIKNRINNNERVKAIFESMIREIEETQKLLKNIRNDINVSQKVKNEVIGLFEKVVVVKNNIKNEMNSENQMRRSMAFLNLSAGNDSRKFAMGLRTQIQELEKLYKKPEVLGIKLSLIKKRPEITEKLNDEDKYALISLINEKLKEVNYSYDETELDKEAFNWVERAEQERTEAGKNKKKNKKGKTKKKKK